MNIMLLRRSIVPVLFALAAVISPLRAQTTVWLPKTTRTPSHITYSYSVQAPDYLAKWILDSYPKSGSSKAEQRTIDGKDYTFLHRHLAWDTGVGPKGACPAKTGQLRLDPKAISFDGDWVQDRQLMTNQEVISVLDALARPSDNPWRSATLPALKWEGAGPPGLTFTEGNPAQPLSKIADGFGQFPGAPQAIGASAGNKLAVAWKDVTGNKVKVASYPAGPGSPCAWVKEYVMLDSGKELETQLAGFACDTEGENLFLLIARVEDMSFTPGWQFRDQVLRLIKINRAKAQAADYTQEWNIELNSDAYAQEAPNGAPGNKERTRKFAPIYSPLNAGTAAIAYGNGKIGIICSANSTPPDPKQRHQCAFRLSVNASDGSVAARTRWFSTRHSFNQRVVYDGSDFVFMDLADSAPTLGFMPGPGINVCKISGATDEHLKVSYLGVDWYCYARHGKGNDTHTWMGDIRPGSSGYTAVFATMRDMTAMTASPRDLALVHIVKNFQDQPQNALSDKLVAGSNLVDTKTGNPAATGDQSFPSAYDGKRPVGNTGIAWLTSYKDATVVKPKLFRIGDQDRYLAVWEKWAVDRSAAVPTAAFSYVETCAMTFDAYGANPSAEISLGIARMDDRSELFAWGSRAAWLVRTPEAVVMHEVDPGNPAAPVSTILPAIPGKAGSSSTPPMVAAPPAAGDDTLPLPAGRELVQGKKYRSPSGGHYMIFQPDGNLAVYTAANQHVWDYRKVAPRWNAAKSVRMNADGNFAVSDAGGGHIWSALDRNPDASATITISPTGALQLVSGKSGQVLWSSSPSEARVWKVVQTLNHANNASCMAWSPDGQKIVTGENTSGMVHIWDAATGAELHALKGHTSHAEAVKWSPDGSKIASSSSDKSVRIWDAGSGKSLHHLTEHTGRVDEIAWSPDGAKLLSSSPIDESVRTWDAASGAALLNLKLSDAPPGSSVAWSPDGAKIAVGTNDKGIQIFGSSTGAELPALAGLKGTPSHLAWSPDGSKLAAGSFDRHLRVWDVASGNVLHTLTWGDEDIPSSVAWSPDGSKLATAHEKPAYVVRILDAATGAVLHSLPAEIGSSSDVAWSPDGSKVASGTWNRILKVWDSKSGASLASMPGSDSATGSGTTLAWSKDGTRIAFLAGLKVLVVSQ